MPAVAALENGEYAATWVQADNAAPARGEAVAQLFSKDGLVKSDSTIRGWSLDQAFWPRVTALDWDRYVIVYENHAGYKIGAKLFDKYLQTNQDIASDVSGSHYMPDVAGYHARNPGVTADDVLYWATWLSTTGPTVYLRRCRLNPSLSCDAAIPVANFGTIGGDDLFPAVAVVPPPAAVNLRGAAIVVWTDDTPNVNEGDLLGRGYFYPAGLQGPMVAAPFPAPIADGDNLNKQMRPDVAMFSDGTFVVAWIGAQDNVQGNIRYRLYQPQCTGLSCQIVPLGTPGMTAQFACDTTNSNQNENYNCNNTRSRAATFDHALQRVALVANTVSGIREFRVGYTYDNVTSLVFYVRHIRPAAGTGAPTFVGELPFPGFALNGNADGENAVNGGALDMWPECGLDFFALWGACSQGSCNEIVGSPNPDYWMNSSAAPW
jgi:hypothetical protein